MSQIERDEFEAWAARNSIADRYAVPWNAWQIAWRASRALALEQAAAMAETWGGHPPSQLGRRAALGAAIRALGKPPA